ncbi:NUDIX domain-containing protein [Elioraea tepida]|uniref:ADP-ribose pyrophosphatase n=1 Tax=Elioraea tepida TaxID=2843330 RepID=A0A975U1J2_9PROT|nr:NUDIX domain-containing protein [Elioraea tepida]QXM24617.1 NUDIX domain-containing protein [Elioraea tepida]
MAELSLPSDPRVTIHEVETLWHGRNALQRVSFSFRGFRGELRGPARWELLRRGRAVAVVPYDPVRDTVVLIEQFRLPALAAGLEPWLVEVAAGLADGDEPDEAVAVRETLEETGLSVTALERAGRFLLSPGVADETITVFAGRVDAPPGEAGHAGLAHEHEDIRVFAVPAESAFAMIAEGRIVNISTALALFWLQANRERLRRAWAA